MSFEENIQKISFIPQTENGRGFLPPILRISGHFLYLLGRLSDTPTRRPTENQIRQELDAVSNHLTDFTIPTFLSQTSKDILYAMLSAQEDLKAEFFSWNEEAQISNLRSLANRLVEVLVLLDREVLGLRDSDSGASL